jgi:phthalate 4,5-dioxygenase
VDQPEVYRARSGQVFLPAGADWVSTTAELRKAFVEHAEADLPI